MDDKELGEKVKSLLKANQEKGHSKSGQADFEYAKPSSDTYPFQFFWDTCFHVFIYCTLGEPEAARKQLESLFALQDENGFVGHILYWNNVLPGRSTDIFQSRPSLGVNLLRTHMSALIQPPFAAQAAARIHDLTKDAEFLKRFLPKLKNYYHWIARNRDFDGDGLVTIITPFESGMDWKPTFDPVLGFIGRKANWRLFLKGVSVDVRNFFCDYNLEKMRERNYFRVKEVGMNTIYIQNLYALADLCREVEDPEAVHFEKLADKALNSLISITYDADEAAFLDVYGPENRKIKILTPTAFFPLILKGIDPGIREKVISTHFFDKQTFAVDYPLPSVAANDPSFCTDETLFLWRGPTWAYLDWFLHGILLENGHEDSARKLTKTVRDLITKSGFREYYHPFTGEGMGARDFTWAGLILDMIAKESRVAQ